jgi:DNA polymerase I-like protein with 3'-5' exonuclease and polymerase domains
MEQKEFKTKFLDEEIQCYYIKDAAQAADALAIMMEQDGIFGIDTETEALPQWHSNPDAPLSPHLAKIRLLQTYNNRAACVFDLKYIPFKLFIPFLEKKRFVAHNAMFDLSFFIHEGCKEVDIGCTYQLTKLMFHASKPDDAGLKASLEAVVAGVFGEEILKKMQTSDWSIPELTFEQIEYAAMDAISVYKLADKLASVITGFKMERYYGLIRAAQLPLVKMQLEGITLNVEGHRHLVEDWLYDLNKARKDVVAVLGSESVTPTTIADYLSTHLEKDTLALWPRTEAGKLQTDVHAFADFAGISPIIAPFAKFQKIKTLTQDFGHKLLNLVNPVTGRLHASYKLSGARTGRLSCSGPNLQQLPRDKDVRSNFISRDNYCFVVADYSQIELRVAAELSQDPAMLNAYRTGVDLHTLTASKVSGKALNEVTKTDRQMAKAVNFGFLFGLGAKKFSHYAKKSYGAEVSEEEASDAIKTFRETYAGYHAWQKRQAEEASVSLKVRTPCGKLRSLDPENTYGTAMNTPVQGGAAECMLYSLIMLDTYATDIGFKVINVVHDEVICEVVNDEFKITQTKAAIEQSMHWGFKKVFPKGISRGLCEVGFGSNWAEAKK